MQRDLEFREYKFDLLNSKTCIVSGDVKENEIVGLRGPSGCGKSTFLRAVAGFHLARSGSVVFGGKNIFNIAPETLRPGYCPQSVPLWESLSVYENLVWGFRFSEKLKNLSEKVKKAKVEAHLFELDLAGFDKRMPSALSGGEKARIALIRCFLLEPNLVLLDEPFSGLDEESLKRAKTYILNQKTKNDLGPIVIVSHHQNDLENFANRRIEWNLENKLAF